MIELNEILLIDDSKGVNALNKRILQEMGVGKKITTIIKWSACPRIFNGQRCERPISVS